MNKTITAALLIILASVALSIFFYPKMPEKIASHWNSQGEIDGYMGRFWGLFLMPAISIVMLFAFILIPKIDPMKSNIEKFRKYFDGFILLIIAFLFYIYLLMLLWNLNFKFSMIQALSPAFAILFYYCGVLIENSKTNWFIGIRTPWTLSSEKVWDKTHKLGGRLFKLTALFALMGAFIPRYAIWLVIVPVAITVVYSFLFSYLEYKKLAEK